MANVKSVGTPNRPGKGGGLGEKIEATIERVIAWVINEAGEAVASILTAGLDTVMEGLARRMAPEAGAMARAIRDNPGVPGYIKEAIRVPSTGTDPSDFVHSVIYILSACLGGFLGMNQPSARLSSYVVDRELASARADPTVAFPMIWRGSNRETMLDHLKDLGWHSTFVGPWEDVLRPRPGVLDLIRAARLRGESTGTIRGELSKRGYEDTDIDALLLTAKMVPGPGDLITMAVREAWRDDVAQQWGYDADFPPEFAEWMQKQGDEDDWARRYWRAHWQLPSMTAAMEMLYRVPEFTEEDYCELLRISDVPATFRDYLLRTAYRPLTRVDVRRMYGMGVLDRAAVKRSYLDLGYNDANAELMTEFTVKFETDADRELTKADILGGYRDGLLTFDEAVAWLTELDYPSERAAYLVSREAAKIARKLTDKQLSSIRKLYVSSDINESEARRMMTTLALASSEIDAKILEWTIDREAKVKRPSRAQLDGFLIEDIVTVDQYTDMMNKLGYQAQYLDWFLQAVLEDKADKARVAEERERDEQQKASEREARTDYQLAKAQIDVDVAELRTAIAETQIALRSRRLRYERELELARQRLTSAEIEEAAMSEIAAWRVDQSELREAMAFLAEQIDGLETTIADIELERAEYRLGVEFAMGTAASDEDRAALSEEARVAELEFDRRRRTEELAKEQAQDDRAAAQAQIATLERQVRERQAQVSRDLEIVTRIATEADVITQWQSDQADIEERLGDLRYNLSLLTESKALLTVGYRAVLVD